MFNKAFDTVENTIDEIIKKHIEAIKKTFSLLLAIDVEPLLN